MSVIEYIKSLAPVSERRDVQTLLVNLQDELNDTLIPVVQEVRESFTGHAFKSGLYSSYEKALRRHVNFNSPAINLLLDSIEKIQANFPFLEKEVNQMFSVQFSSTNMQYNSVNLLRYIESTAFYVRYARKFLLNLVAEETVAAGAGTPPQWCKAEKEYLMSNLENFAGLFDAMQKSESELRSIFSKVSNAQIDEGTAEIAARSLGQSRIDPMRLNNFSPQRNWIFALGKAITEWQHRRHLAAKEELLALQLRLQEWNEIKASGRASPRHQAAIVRLEDRIEKLDSRIQETEEEFAYR